MKDEKQIKGRQIKGRESSFDYTDVEVLYSIRQSSVTGSLLNITWEWPSPERSGTRYRIAPTHFALTTTTTGTGLYRRSPPAASSLIT